MLELKAFDKDSRRTRQEIAEKAEGAGVNVDLYAEPLADLKHRGLIDSITGRGGGSWLLAPGAEFARQI